MHPPLDRGASQGGGDGAPGRMLASGTHNSLPTQGAVSLSCKIKRSG